MTLRHIDNDDVFVNHDFKPISPKSSNTLSPTEQRKQIDQDYLLALSIEEEEKKLANQASVMDFENMREYEEVNTLNDEEIARKLQEEEEKLKLNVDNIRKRIVADRSHPEYNNAKPHKQQLETIQENSYLDGFDQRFEEIFNQCVPKLDSQSDSQLHHYQQEQKNRSEQYRSNRQTHLNVNSSTENHTQSSSSRDRNTNHHSNSHHHGHHSKQQSNSKVRNKRIKCFSTFLMLIFFFFPF